MKDSAMWKPDAEAMELLREHQSVSTVQAAITGPHESYTDTVHIHKLSRLLAMLVDHILYLHQQVEELECPKNTTP